MGNFLDKIGLALFKSLLDAEKLFLPGTGESSVVMKTSLIYSPNSAIGRNSFAHGESNTASGHSSHAEGNHTTTGGMYSHAEGHHTNTTQAFEHAQGAYNRSNTGTRHSVGIGSSETDRKNAEQIMSDGRFYMYGVGGYDGTNPSAAKTVQEVLTTGVTNEEIDALFGDDGGSSDESSL